LLARLPVPGKAVLIAADQLHLKRERDEPVGAAGLRVEEVDEPFACLRGDPGDVVRRLVGVFHGMAGAETLDDLVVNLDGRSGGQVDGRIALIAPLVMGVADGLGHEGGYGLVGRGA
jgi:hypothetical protein